MELRKTAARKRRALTAKYRPPFSVRFKSGIVALAKVHIDKIKLIIILDKGNSLTRKDLT